MPGRQAFVQPGQSFGNLTGNVVRAVTWNTANIDTYDNVSHAEHHFVSWLSGQEDLLPRITRMHLNLQPLSPCGSRPK